VDPRLTSARRTSMAGIAMAVANTAIGAVHPVITRWGALHAEPLLFISGSAIAAAVCVVPVLYWRGELHYLLDTRYLPRLFGISMLGTVATSLCLIYGLKRIGAITGVLLMQSEPVYSVAIATLLVGERPSFRQLVATAGILAGIFSVFSADGGFAPSWSAMLLLMAPLFWQLSHVLSLRVMPPLTPHCVVGARYTFAAAALGLIFLLSHPTSLAGLDLRLLAAIATTGSLVYFPRIA
jgi:drug/metabolite transporter (DMT)-like permease